VRGLGRSGAATIARMSSSSQAVVSSGVPAAERVQRIERSDRWLSLDFRELWNYRELLFVLVWRDVAVRYKQTILGATWAIFQPLVSMVVFTVVFGHLAGVKPEYGVPYPLFVFAGLLPWTYFAASLTLSSQSLVSNANLVTKVYFPRLLIPLASIAVPIVDFVIALGVLGGMFAWYGRLPSWHIVFIVVFVLMALLTALGVGLWLSALNARYRDVPYIVPFMTQLWFFLTPVVYGVGLVPQDWRWLIALNPMAGVVDGFRWATLGGGDPHYQVLATSAVIAVLLTLSGLVYFRKVERGFADVI
jgi:lipopolysaccharide transport system permease protein